MSHPSRKRGEVRHSRVNRARRAAARFPIFHSADRGLPSGLRGFFVGSWEGDAFRRPKVSAPKQAALGGPRAAAAAAGFRGPNPRPLFRAPAGSQSRPHSEDGALLFGDPPLTRLFPGPSSVRARTRLDLCALIFKASLGRSLGNRAIHHTRPRGITRARACPSHQVPCAARRRANADGRMRWSHPACSALDSGDVGRWSFGCDVGHT
ncbi:hypothetical protein HPB50_001918 [Hyalomma asiaticum]|uniref:Uncharacterized protein n=1 Tax=Hyalomma asiaticum TaxID=266040 RepID=A0ACB7T9C2_HYAAI|nr:hypothetical protein HPB50_001918 [Hyalomma asiaticum]